jgi:hypothetical protein
LSLLLNVLSKRWLTVAALAAISGSAASADILLLTSSALTNADPTQLGRLSRNAIPQDWSGTEIYPGVINTTTAYHYTTFAVNVGSTPFLQIDFDDVATSEFVSAYQTSYNPSNLATNWLGDAGTSGNYFGTDPVFFQVIAAAPFSTVIIVVNNTTGGALPASNGAFTLTVEAYTDTNYTPTPEPASAALTAGGLALIGWKFRKRSLVSASGVTA